MEIMGIIETKNKSTHIIRVKAGLDECPPEPVAALDKEPKDSKWRLVTTWEIEIVPATQEMVDEIHKRLLLKLSEGESWES